MPAESDYYRALMSSLSHLIKRKVVDWAMRCDYSPHLLCCTKCKRPPVNGQLTQLHIIRYVEQMCEQLTL